MLPNSFQDWKPFIDGGKVIFGFENMKMLIKEWENIKYARKGRRCSLIKTYLWEHMHFFLGLDVCIQHEEWIEKRIKLIKIMFHTRRMINRYLLSFWLANAKGTKWNIKNPNFLPHNLNQPWRFLELGIHKS